MSHEELSPLRNSDAANSAIEAANKAQEEKPSLLSLTKSFGNAVLNSAIEHPVNGLAELSNHVLHTDFGSMHTFDLKRSVNTADSIAQQAGSAVGLFVPFMAARGGVRFVAKNAIGLSESTSLLGTVGENAATGFTMGFTMTPSDEKDGFWTSRLKHGAVDAGVFAVMSGTQHSLQSKFMTPEIRESLPLAARIERSSLIGMGSGLPAGFTQAELQSLSDGKGFASKDQVIGDMTGFAMFGGLMGPLDAIMPTNERVKASENELENMYAKRTPFQEAVGRAAVKHDLSLHRAYDTAAQGMSDSVSVFDKLQEAGLDSTQMNRVMTSLAYVREGFAKQRGTDGLIEPDQKGNWLHTMDELDAMLDRTKGQSPELIEKSIMAMFGDSWKTKLNFTRHNYDGANVSKIVLGRMTDRQFTPEDVHGVSEANKEHQVSPPGLMGVLYANKIGSVLQSERQAEWLNLKQIDFFALMKQPEKMSRLDELNAINNRFNSRRIHLDQFKDRDTDGFPMTEEDEALRKSLQDRNRFGSFISDSEYDTLVSLQKKIADPHSFELQRTESGGMAVKLTPEEQQMLRLSGIDHWHVPHESTPWYAESRNGVVADILANLGLGGRRKLTGLNGPETDPVFQFGTIRECVNSALKTYADIDKILTPEEYSYVQNRLGTMNGAIENAMTRVKDWLQEDPTLKDNPDLKNVPFWDTALKYPSRGEHDARWWYFNRTPAAQRAPETQAYWDQHRFDGLNESEKQDYLRAIQIRNRVVEELGKELRLDNQFVPDFKPVMQRRGLMGAYDGYQARRSNAG